MLYDFDKVVDRTGTNCIKWDFADLFFGTKGPLPMWVADMDFEAPKPVIEAIKKRAEHGVFGYTGRPDSYYDAVIGWLGKKAGWKIDREWIDSAPGVVSAIHLSIMALSHPGDSVIVQTPVYYPFFSAVKHTGRQLIKSSLKNVDGHYEMDLDDLERKIDSRTRIMILCSPHNPVSRVWKRDELAKLGEICSRSDIKIISDEIHSDLVFDGYKHTPIASLSEEFAMRTITCIAPSKTFNLAGLSAACVIIPEKKLMNEYKNMASSAGIGLTNLFGVVALEAAYSSGEEWLEQLLPYIRENYNYMRDFLAENLPEIVVTELEGTYLAWLDFRQYGLSVEELRDALYTRARVGFEDGSVFGEEGMGFMRVNLACPRAIVKEAMTRLLGVFRDIRKE